MSHYHERKEKVCLNCAAALHGRYCHSCGQENIEPKETVWGLLTHFVYDITHFDGKFFSTLRYLLMKPGFLSREYIRGKRASYLHPIRMYIFSSALFFIVFFSRFDIKGESRDRLTSAVDSAFVISRAKNEELRRARTADDLPENNEKRQPATAGGNVDTPASPTEMQDSAVINIYDTKYTSRSSYDSAQKALLPALRDSWIRTRIIHKQFELNEKAAKNPSNFVVSWFSLFVHSFPQLLFVSLPLFALLLKLLYVRHRRFYYTDHGIFSIHLYVFTFISLLLTLLLLQLSDSLSTSFFTYINLLIGLYVVYYTYRAMRNFYGQGALKTFVKYFLLVLSSSCVILLLFAVFLFLSILKF